MFNFNFSKPKPDTAKDKDRLTNLVADHTARIHDLTDRLQRLEEAARVLLPHVEKLKAEDRERESRRCPL